MLFSKYEGVFHESIPKMFNADYGFIDATEFTKKHLHELAEGIWMFPLFTEGYCQYIIDECNKYGKWKSEKGDPAYGQEIRFDKFSRLLNYQHTNEIVGFIMNPIFTTLFRSWVASECESPFVIKYTMDTQQNMSLHIDEQALMTVAVNLNNGYEGGGTYFPRQQYNSKNVPVGYGLLFAGGSPLGEHEGAAITSGERYLLSYWIR